LVLDCFDLLLLYALWWDKLFAKQYQNSLNHANIKGYTIFVFSNQSHHFASMQQPLSIASIYTIFHCIYLCILLPHEFCLFIFPLSFALSSLRLCITIGLDHKINLILNGQSMLFIYLFGSFQFQMQIKNHPTQHYNHDHQQASHRHCPKKPPIR
jgi:hypothetical protein